jgi:hypothetical protein
VRGNLPSGTVTFLFTDNVQGSSGAAEREGTRFPSWDGERERRVGELLGRQSELATASSSGRSLDLWDGVALALGEDEAQTVP